MSEELDLIPAGYVSFNRVGTILEVNRILSELLGYTTAELHDKNVEILFTVSSRVFFNTHLLPTVILRSKVDEVFISLLQKDGSHIPAIGNFVLTGDQDDSKIKVILMPAHQRKKYEDEIRKEKDAAVEALDRNETVLSLTRQLQEQTEKFDRQLTLHKIVDNNRRQFNEILAHDFQEPIRKILMFSDILMKSESITEEEMKSFERIVRAARRLKNLTALVEEFLTLDTELLSTDADLAVILDEACRMAMERRNFNDLDLEADCLPPIQGFPKQLKVLFLNLFDNAIQYRDPTRRLAIAVHCVTVKENLFQSIKEKYNYQDHIKITFSDNGIGFSNEYSEYVFQLLKKITPQSTGLGFGLPTCKKIVENHFGTISVHSTPGQGTTFTILLPTKYFGR